MKFDEFADRYEEIHDSNVKLSGEDSVYFTKYKSAYLAAHLPPDTSKKILDFGCGIGRLLLCIREDFPQASLHGFDPSHESIQKAKKSLPPETILVDSKVQLKSDYDLIVVANVLHHIPLDQRAELIQELSNRLNPGGQIFIFEHNPLNPLTQWVVSQCEFDADAVLLSPREIFRYLQNAKMKISQRDYIVFFPKLLAGLRFLEKYLSWLPLGAQYAVVAEKRS